MKKIGILTYHHVANWGSVLQAACIYKFLTRIYPRERVELINYVTETSHGYNRARLYLKAKRFGFAYNTLNKGFHTRMQRCTEFLQRHVRMSSQMLLSNDLEKGRQFLEKQEYDTVYVGSDTVFQLGPYAGNRYIAAPQPPNLYFLPFTAHFRKIAMAASVDPFRTEHLARPNLDQITRAFHDFTHIFYRDETTHEVLHELGLEESQLSYLPDPSLLVDFDAFCSIEPQLQGDNLAGVAIGNRRMGIEAIQALRKLGYTPVDLMGEISQGGLLSTANIASLEEFISLHRQLKLVITDRFHGSIKALVMADCPIIGIEDVSKYPLRNSKLRDLYRKFGIEDLLAHLHDEKIDEKWILEKIERWRSSRLDIMTRICQLRLDALHALKQSKVIESHDT